LLNRGCRAEATIVVDDLPESWVGYQDNVIPVKKFRDRNSEANLRDNELDLLLGFLEKLSPMDDIRPVPKGQWRDRAVIPERHDSLHGADR
jgi:hypothetical protein